MYTENAEARKERLTRAYLALMGIESPRVTAIRKAFWRLRDAHVAELRKRYGA
jgi:hypothetical protein